LGGTFPRAVLGMRMALSYFVAQFFQHGGVHKMLDCQSEDSLFEDSLKNKPKKRTTVKFFHDEGKVFIDGLRPNSNMRFL
jgi:hypothetical protein